MRYLILSLALLAGCETFHCAPKDLLEGCMKELEMHYPGTPGSQAGPMCVALDQWAKLHDYAVGGVLGKPQPKG